MRSAWRAGWSVAVGCRHNEMPDDSTDTSLDDLADDEWPRIPGVTANPVEQVPSRRQPNRSRDTPGMLL